MNTRLHLLLIGLGGLLVIAVFTFPMWQSLVVREASEDPFEVALQVLPQDMQAELRVMATQNPQMAATMAVAAATSVTVPEDEETMPEMTDPVILSSGSFIRIDALHEAEGTATIYQLPDGSRVLRLEDFRSTNGPDLHVILSTDPNPRSHDALGENYVELGRLKGNVGNQNYDIPADVDLSQFQSVVIYCQQLQVVFSMATLTAV
jgi:hypothetical protein